MRRRVGNKTTREVALTNNAHVMFVRIWRNRSDAKSVILLEGVVGDTTKQPGFITPLKSNEDDRIGEDFCFARNLKR